MHTTPRTEHHTCRDHEEAGTASETDKRPLKASHPPGHAPHDKHIYRILEIRISVQSQVSHAALCTQKRTVPESANSHSISHIPSAISHAPSATRHQPATRHAPSATRRNFKAQSCSPRGRAEAGGKRGGRALRAQPRALSPLPKVPLGPRPWLASGPKAVEDGRGRGFRRVLRKAGHGRRGCSVSCRIECRLPRPGSSARRDWPFTKARVDGCRL